MAETLLADAGNVSGVPNVLGRMNEQRFWICLSSRRMSAEKRFGSKKPILFQPFQIAHLNINELGDDAYGIGIIFSRN